MQHLIETLEEITDACEWGLAAEWSRDNLVERLGEIMAQVRYAIEEARDLALIENRLWQEEV